jgi:single-strand DNA-binding protein
MSNEQQITIIGRLAGDPELRFTPSGHAVASFTVVSNARRFDKQANEWKDEPPNWWRCIAWRDMGENIANSLAKGVGVILQGNIQTREYTTKDGEKKSSVEVDVQAIGPDLRWATATVVKAQRTSGGGQPAAQTQTADPWATGPTNQPGRASQASVEPPF